MKRTLKLDIALNGAIYFYLLVFLAQVGLIIKRTWGVATLDYETSITGSEKFIMVGALLVCVWLWGIKIRGRLNDLFNRWNKRAK